MTRPSDLDDFVPDFRHFHTFDNRFPMDPSEPPYGVYISQNRSLVKTIGLNSHDALFTRIRDRGVDAIVDDLLLLDRISAEQGKLLDELVALTAKEPAPDNETEMLENWSKIVGKLMALMDDSSIPGKALIASLISYWIPTKRRGYQQIASELLDEAEDALRSENPRLRRIGAVWCCVESLTWTSSQSRLVPNETLRKAAAVFIGDYLDFVREPSTLTQPARLNDTYQRSDDLLALSTSYKRDLWRWVRECVACETIRAESTNTYDCIDPYRLSLDEVRLRIAIGYDYLPFSQALDYCQRLVLALGTNAFRLSAHDFRQAVAELPRLASLKVGFASRSDWVCTEVEGGYGQGEIEELYETLLLALSSFDVLVLAYAPIKELLRLVEGMDFLIPTLLASRERRFPEYYASNHDKISWGWGSRTGHHVNIGDDRLASERMENTILESLLQTLGKTGINREKIPVELMQSLVEQGRIREAAVLCLYDFRENGYSSCNPLDDDTLANLYLVARALADRYKNFYDCEYRALRYSFFLLSHELLRRIMEGDEPTTPGQLELVNSISGLFEDVRGIDRDGLKWEASPPEWEDIPNTSGKFCETDQAELALRFESEAHRRMEGKPGETWEEAVEDVKEDLGHWLTFRARDANLLSAAQRYLRILRASTDHGTNESGAPR